MKTLCQYDPSGPWSDPADADLEDGFNPYVREPGPEIDDEDGALPEGEFGER